VSDVFFRDGDRRGRRMGAGLTARRTQIRSQFLEDYEGNLGNSRQKLTKSGKRLQEWARVGRPAGRRCPQPGIASQTPTRETALLCHCVGPRTYPFHHSPSPAGEANARRTQIKCQFLEDSGNSHQKIIKPGKRFQERARVGWNAAGRAPHFHLLRGPLRGTASGIL